jgi:hypothetical protein
LEEIKGDIRMKKMLGIFIVFLFISPLTSIIGESQDIKILNKDSIEKNNFTDDIISMINQVDENIIRNYLEDFVSFGYKKTGSENCKLTAEYIYDKFLDFGLHTYFDNWWYPRYKISQRVLLVDRNVVAVHNGSDPSSDAVIIVCAHYDTIDPSAKKNNNYGSPGANDDGSGIVTMLSIAEIVSQYSFNHTFRFVAFSGEEEGCFGSFYDAKQAYHRDENIIAVFNIDGVGYINNSEDGKIVQLNGLDRSNWIVDYTNDIADKYEDYLDIKAQRALQYPCDHESYNDYGYDGVQFVQPKPETFPWWHSPEDTIDKINFTYLTKVVKLVLATTAELANKSFDVQIRIRTPYEGRVYLFNIPLFKTPGFNFFLSKIRGLTYLIGRAKVTVDIITDEQINSVYFGIDGYRIHACNEPPYEWIIGKDKYDLSFRKKGFHRLSVCLNTNNGNTAYDEMDIFIVKLV